MGEKNQVFIDADDYRRLFPFATGDQDGHVIPVIVDDSYIEMAISAIEVSEIDTDPTTRPELKEALKTVLNHHRDDIESIGILHIEVLPYLAQFTGAVQLTTAEGILGYAKELTAEQDQTNLDQLR